MAAGGKSYLELNVENSLPHVPPIYLFFTLFFIDVKLQFPARQNNLYV